jgi:hypothetical protein
MILLHPTDDWGPALEQYRMDYKYNKRSYTWLQRLRFSDYTQHINITTAENGSPEKVALYSMKKDHISPS